MWRKRSKEGKYAFRECGKKNSALQVGKKVKGGERRGGGD